MLKRLKGMFTHQAKSNATTTRATTITLVEEKSAKKELKRIGQSWRAEPHPNEDEVESRYLSLVLVARETALSGPVTTLLTVVDLDFSCSELSSRSRGVKDGALGGDVL